MKFLFVSGIQRPARGLLYHLQSKSMAAGSGSAMPSSVSGSSAHSTSARLSPEEQAAGYALEILGSTSGTRHHAFMIIMRGSYMRLWYYDAAGIISTSDRISMVNDFGMFAAVLVAFYCCSEKQWGGLDIVKHIPSVFPFRTLEGGKIDFEGGHVVLGKMISSQHVLVGRRTTVYRATIKQAGEADRSGVVKISYQAVTRAPEWQLIKRAQADGVEHLPEVIFYRDFTKSSDGVRHAPPFPGGSDQYEDRVLRAVVFPFYHPISEVLSQDNFIEVLHQLVGCELFPTFRVLLLMLTEPLAS